MADTLTPEQRSYCMSRIRGFDTSLELAVRSELHKRGARYRCNVQSMPGRPDLLFTSARLVVFIDGDFWHGYRYPQWKDRLSEYWKAKIERNRARDRRNHRRLRRAGWRVLRVWEHEIRSNAETCALRIHHLLMSQ